MRQLLSRQCRPFQPNAVGKPAASSGGVIGERWALTGTTGINAPAFLLFVSLNYQQPIGPNVCRSICRRLALMPCINASFATDTPGCKLASINSLGLRVVAA
ncbi:MAG: hypothetical protein IPP59_20325 [Betaproteobacteria bacterium]|nr:hypothetical protein [Candidatus Dechloromonas phosphorivorans]